MSEIATDHPGFYYLTNRDEKKVYRHRQRARQRAMPDTLTNEQWQHAINYFNVCCAVCESPLYDLSYSITYSTDHWIPISSEDCPGTIATNMIPLCHGEGGCDNSKSNKVAYDWLKGEYGTRKANEIINRIELYFMSIKDKL